MSSENDGEVVLPLLDVESPANVSELRSISDATKYFETFFGHSRIRLQRTIPERHQIVLEMRPPHGFPTVLLTFVCTDFFEVGVEDRHSSTCTTLEMGPPSEGQPAEDIE